MTKEELFKQMNELCEKVKIQEMDIEEILKIRQIKNLKNKSSLRTKKKS